MRVKTKEEFAKYCQLRHDIECNQKYGMFTYSYHLNMVAENTIKFAHLLPDYDSRIITFCGAWGHDLIEDARITYNDIINLIKIKGIDGRNLNEDIAEVIYSCTEEKGKNRSERLSTKFYEELTKNKLGVYVKLCDILANATESKSTGHGMFKKYVKEYSKLKSILYMSEYDEIFKELEKVLEL